jgi:hypothetical protein
MYSSGAVLVLVCWAAAVVGWARRTTLLTCGQKHHELLILLQSSTHAPGSSLRTCWVGAAARRGVAANGALQDEIEICPMCYSLSSTSTALYALTSGSPPHNWHRWHRWQADSSLSCLASLLCGRAAALVEHHGLLMIVTKSGSTWSELDGTIPSENEGPCSSCLPKQTFLVASVRIAGCR